jgi:hypothetical protein
MVEGEEGGVEKEELLQHETEGVDLVDSEDDEEDEDEIAEIKEENKAALQEKYEVLGQPDFYHYKRVIPESLIEAETTRVMNDWFLSRQKSIPFFGRAINKVAVLFSDYEIRSGYDKKTNKFADFVLDYRPLHAMTEGGKGLTQNTRPVVMLHAVFSEVNNIIFGHGCPAQCSFCKESLIARGFTEVAVSESTGILHLETDLDGEHLSFDTPSKAKVGFFDTTAEIMVYGPIGIAIARGYPILKDSICKIIGKSLTRYLSD